MQLDFSFVAQKNRTLEKLYCLTRRIQESETAMNEAYTFIVIAKAVNAELQRDIRKVIEKLKVQGK